MSKEQVIVFDGEDKFIAPREISYDVRRGVSIGADGTETPNTSEGDIFKAYMAADGQTVSLPSPIEPDYCVQLENFIVTRGGGLATPEQIMEAHQLFLTNCVQTTSTTTSTTTAAPITTSDTTTTTTSAPTTTSDTTTTTTAAPSTTGTNTTTSDTTTTTTLKPSVVPIVPVSFGVPLSSIKTEEKIVKKSNSSWVIWLLIGGAAVYLLTRKKY